MYMLCIVAWTDNHVGVHPWCTPRKHVIAADVHMLLMLPLVCAIPVTQPTSHFNTQLLLMHSIVREFLTFSKRICIHLLCACASLRTYIIYTVCYKIRSYIIYSKHFLWCTWLYISLNLCINIPACTPTPQYMCISVRPGSVCCVRFLMTPPGKLTVAVLSAQSLMWVIMTSQTCSREEWRSGDPCSLFFFHIPVAHYSKRKEGEIDRERERQRLNIWPKPECDFVFT